MNPEAATSKASILPNRVAGLILALLALVASGCQQGSYKASALPVDLIAPELVDVGSLDLSKLASGASSQRINPGDSVNMTIVTGVEERQPEAWLLRVSDDGSLNVPLIGSVQLAGYDVQTAQAVVRDASVKRGIYRQPTVSITIQDRQTNHIAVVGAVNEPNEFDLPVANSNLLSAINNAGGLSDHADRIIEIRQPAQVVAGPNGPVQTPPRTVQVDLQAATQSPTGTQIPLADGAVVNVRKRDQRFIHVLGLVNRPDQFELPANKNVRVLDAVALAGGRRFSFADKAFVVRQIPGNPDPALIEVSIQEAKEDSTTNIVLQDGDVVSVEETPTTLLLGTLQQFIRVGVNGSVSVF